MTENIIATHVLVDLTQELKDYSALVTKYWERERELYQFERNNSLMNLKWEYGEEVPKTVLDRTQDEKRKLKEAFLEAKENLDAASQELKDFWVQKILSAITLDIALRCNQNHHFDLLTVLIRKIHELFNTGYSQGCPNCRDSIIEVTLDHFQRINYPIKSMMPILVELVEAADDTEYGTWDRFTEQTKDIFNNIGE